MYEKCLTCPEIGVTCDGPNFVAMSAQELLAWCKARKAHLKLSNQKIADLAGMPKGTIDRLFAGEHMDIRWETVRPLVRALMGGAWNDNPCPDAPENVGAAAQAEIEGLRQQIKQLEHEIAWHEDKQKMLQKDNDSLQMLVTNTNARLTKDKDFLRSQITSKNRTIAILAVLFGVSLAVILAALIVDRLNPEVGFFWLRSLGLFGGNRL